MINRINIKNRRNASADNNAHSNGIRYYDLLVAVLAVLLVAVVSVVRYRSDEVNYLNADATWHTLLTIEAYNETPVSDHLFLPIVSLGDDADKFISWGATVPDENGNYFYTSFSPAGYVAPWLFMKILGLEVCESSLYIFNSALFAISAALWGIFISWFFGHGKDKIWFSIIGMLTYVLTPELLHGMGIVYWHQSLMQVTLLAQIMAFWRMKESDSKSAGAIFYILALLNPYIEWTGYIANVGFALAELLLGYKESLKKAFGRAIVLGAITTAAFGIFIGHYLLRLDGNAFFEALKIRFMARNFTTSSSFIRLFGSYLNSFLLLWVLLLILVIWNIAKKQSIELKHGMIMLVLVFPVIENLVMKNHAILYPYDKMKAGFVLSFLVCELAYQLLDSTEKKKAVIASVSGLVLITGVLNLNSYTHDETYIWSTSYQEENRQIAAYINKNYPESVMGIRAGVRGYMNVLFGRGIYECVGADALKSIAAERGMRYAIILDIEDSAENAVYDLGRATVYDVETGDISKIVIDAGNLTTVDLITVLDGEKFYQLSPLTDQNWTAGYHNNANILLFEYNEELLQDLLQSKNILCKGKSFRIKNIESAGQWIRVSVGSDASVCKYPSYIQLE